MLEVHVQSANGFKDILCDDRYLTDIAFTNIMWNAYTIIKLIKVIVW